MEKILNVWFTPDRIYIRTDADEIYSRLLDAFPLLKEASTAQREEYTIESEGEALRWSAIDEDIHITSFFEGDGERTPNELAAIFKHFPQLKVSEIARNAGISQSLLAKYVYGIKQPSDQSVEQVKTHLRSLGRELAAI